MTTTYTTQRRPGQRHGRYQPQHFAPRALPAIRRADYALGALVFFITLAAAALVIVTSVHGLAR